MSTQTSEPPQSDATSDLKALFANLKLVNAEQLLAIDAARPALARLVQVCEHKTGQGFKLRALLYGMWNGKPADLSDTLGLDWQLKKDFCAVLLAFGAEFPGNKFFYTAFEEAFAEQGLLAWFVDEANA
jgi:hypothetical protein